MGLFGLSQVSLAQVALTENFEGTTFPPAGWTTVDTNPTRNWFRISAETSTTEPIAGAASAAVGYDETNASDEALISPSFSLVGYTAAYLNFTVVASYEWMVDPNSNGDIKVSVSTDGGTQWTQVWFEEDEDVAWEGYTPIVKRLDIGAIAAGQGNVKIKFQYEAQNADLVMVDDISVTACPPISNLALTALTAGGPAFTWEGTSGEYTIEYGPVGFTQGEGQTVTANTEAYTFDNLTAGTAYSFYFRSTCGGLTTSGWDGPYTLAVPITAPTTVPYEYGFEAYNLAAGGWASSTVAATGGAWNMYAGPAEYIYEGEVFAGVVGTGAATNAWLFSRGLNLVGGTDITISYWLRKANLSTNGVSTNNSMVVTIGTDKTAAAQATTIATHNDITDEVYTEQTYTYTVPASGIYYLGFHATTGAQTAPTQGVLLLDSVSILGETAGTDEALASKLSVFPNPAANVINVVNNNNILVNGIQIVDLNGRTVKSAKFNGVTEAQVNISDLASGMYMMTVSSDKGTMTQKIVKN